MQILHTLLQIIEERVLPNISQEASITLISKPAFKKITRKIQNNILHEYRCKTS
jgi:hypothetical protein